MNTLRTVLSLSLLLSFSAPLIGADQKVGWAPSRPTKPILYNQPQEKAFSYAEEYPITMALIKADVNHLRTEALKKKADTVTLALTEHQPKVIYDPVNDMQCEEVSAVCTFENNFNEKMQQPLAQKIVQMVTQQEAQSRPTFERQADKVVLNLGQKKLDRFTAYETLLQYDAQTEGSIRFVKCITTFYKMADLEKFFSEIEKGEASS